MTIFENPFFSIQGQIERIQNVGATLVAAVSGKGVQSNTGNTVVDSVLSKAASNPFGTALAVAVVANPTAALGTAKSAFNSLSPIGKVAAGVSAPIVISAAVANPKIISGVANTPKTLSSFGSDLGTFSKTPSISTFENLVSNNKAISGIIGAGALATIGTGTVGTISTILNTQAVKKNTAASLPQNNLGGTGTTNKYDAKVAEINAESQTQIAKIQSKTASTTGVSAPQQAISSPTPVVAPKKKKKVTKKKKKAPRKPPKKKKKAKTIKRKPTKKKNKGKK